MQKIEMVFSILSLIKKKIKRVHLIFPEILWGLHTQSFNTLQFHEDGLSVAVIFYGIWCP